MNISSTDKSIEAIEIQNHPDFEKVISAWRKTKDERAKERYDILIQFTKFKSISKVSQHLNVDRKTVRKWIVRFQESGFEGLKDKQRSGRKSILLDEDIALIEKTLKEDIPEHLNENQWHAKGIANYLHLPYHPVLRFLKTKGIDIDNFPYNRSPNNIDQQLHPKDPPIKLAIEKVVDKTLKPKSKDEEEQPTQLNFSFIYLYKKRIENTNFYPLFNFQTKPTGSSLSFS